MGRSSFGRSGDGDWRDRTKAIYDSRQSRDGKSGFFFSNEWKQNQMSLFEWADTSEDDWTPQQKVDAQLEILGVSVAVHPLELVSDKLSSTEAITTLDA